MPLKQRLSLFYIHPFGKSFAPPLIILGNLMELGKIKSNNLHLISSLNFDFTTTNEHSTINDERYLYSINFLILRYDPYS